MAEIRGVTGPKKRYVFSVGKDQHYCAPDLGFDDEPSRRIDLDDWAPVTVFVLPVDAHNKVHMHWLKAKVADYSAKDDVFSVEFLSYVLFCGTQAGNIEITDEAEEYLQNVGTLRVISLSSPALLPGPYVVKGKVLRDVWKLRFDTSLTCRTTLKPQLSHHVTPETSIGLPMVSEPFVPFEQSDSKPQLLAFALSSRIKSQAVYSSHIAGLRILVNETKHLGGMDILKQSERLPGYSPSRRPWLAPCLERLVRRGVVVTGIAKMVQDELEDSGEKQDLEGPWNVRGDGLQLCGGRSSGSAAAIAAYDWLDIAIVTDSCGDLMRLALMCGSFGLRPTSSAIDPFENSRRFDIPGILGRDLQKCREFAANWLAIGELQSAPQAPIAILWATDYWNIISPDPDQLAAACHLCHVIGSSLKTACHPISFKKYWMKNPPAEAKNLSLDEFIGKAVIDARYDTFDGLKGIQESLKHFEACKLGSSSETEFTVSQLKDEIMHMMKQYRNDIRRRLNIFREWFQHTIMRSSNSNALVIMPVEAEGPRYRDDIPRFRRDRDGISAVNLGPVMGSPVLTVPITQISYHRCPKDGHEKLPFAVAIMSSPGFDLALMDLVLKALDAANLPIVLKTGKSMW